MQGVLGLAVELWTFGSPEGLQILTFSKCWASPPHLAKVGLRHMGVFILAKGLGNEKHIVHFIGTFDWNDFFDQMSSWKFGQNEQMAIKMAMA